MSSDKKAARTRFAPSPTGFMHVGGARTALFAWLVAKQKGGQFILRIEDTDKSREVAGSEKHITECLGWLGLEWDEGPDKDGAYGPYRQSQRLDIYKDWAAKLIKAGRAYADPYSAAELEELRQKSIAAKKPFLFREHRPKDPLTWDGSQPLRFKSEPKKYGWTDAVMGKLDSGPEAIDDFIILKSDGYPTYNFAHIVDDYLMEVSHVIRSQEFLPSVPRFLNLYDALGIKPPVLATLPYVLGPEGTKKLSKRDGVTDILDYRTKGFLPEALVNFLASLGWNDGTEQEIYSVEELNRKFDLAKVQRSGARFDEQRLLWMNGYWIRQLALDELYQRSESFWPKTADLKGDEYKKRVLGLIQERLKYLGEIPELANFFFEDLPIDLKLVDNNKQLSKLTREQLRDLLEKSRAALDKTDFSVDGLNSALNSLLAQTEQKPGILFSLIRIATTWSPASPQLDETLSLLGRGTSLHRLERAIAALATQA